MIEQVTIHGGIDENCAKGNGIFLRPLDGQCHDTDVVGIEMTTHEEFHPLLVNVPNVSPFKNKFCVASQKTSMFTYEQGKQITICNGTNFMKPGGFFTKMKARKMVRCPFMNGIRICDKFKYKVRLVYFEATNPVNGVSSPELNAGGFLTADSPLFTGNYATLATDIPPWELDHSLPFGSSHSGSCSIKVSLVTGLFNPSTGEGEAFPLDPDNLCQPVYIQAEATLLTLGLPWMFLEGQPVDEVGRAACGDFRDGLTTIFNGWLGVTYPLGPVGLVMGLDWRVEPDGWEDCET